MRVALITAALAATAGSAFPQGIPGALPESAAALARGEWPAYAGTYAAARYSPLEQINRENASGLRVAWRWRSPDHEVRERGASLDPSWLNEGTPLMVNGTLYVSTSLSQVAAIDAVTGKTRWVYDPKIYERWNRQPANNGWLHRGVAYWRSGDDERILIATAYAFLIALDAKTGKPVATFGKDGWVDLLEGLRRRANRNYYTVTSPPVVVRDVVVVGSGIMDWPAARPMPPGDVRGFDARSGRQLWTFKTIPEAGELGAETWEKDSWKDNGNTNVWAPMSADEELGYVYLPVSTPSNDYYGGHRPGDNLYGESLVCIEAASGRKVWHYQFVRHGVWDYDLPAAPNLVDVSVGGRRIKAVAQVTKQNFVFVFDRVTGTPVWPIEDRPVPASKVPGERLAPTQPFPTRPAPLDIQGVREEDLNDLTPELKREALEIVRRYDYGPLYTPPTERGTIQNPGVGGGASWSGAAVDPETGVLYAETHRGPHVVTIRKPRAFETAGVDYIGEFRYLRGPQGLNLFKPPFGSLVAIDLNTGEHKWRVPLGTGPVRHPALAQLGIKEKLGWEQRGWALPTRTVLFALQNGYLSNPRASPVSTGRRIYDYNNLEPKLYVYDKASGALIAEIALPANASGAPMTYLAGGKQYLVFPAGGSNLTEELIALALP